MSGYHWLASYPKSGNTWLRLALASVKEEGAAPDFTTENDFAPVAGDRAAFDLRLDVDSSDLRRAEIEALLPDFYAVDARRDSAPQARKVHDAWTHTASGAPLFPSALTRAAIYIVRDPRDVAVSLAHHFESDIDHAIAFMGDERAALAGIRGRSAQQLPQRLLSWSGHVTSWLNAPVTPLVIRYEDMLAEPEETLAKAASHLGWAANAETVAQAAAATRFAVLQAAEARHGFLEKAHVKGRFFRQGRAGGWRDALTAAQASRIEARHGAIMAELGYR